MVIVIYYVAVDFIFVVLNVSGVRDPFETFPLVVRKCTENK